MTITTETRARWAVQTAATVAAQPAITAAAAEARELLDTLLEQADELYPDDTVDVFTLSPRGNFYGAFVRDDGTGRLVVLEDDDMEDADLATLTANLLMFLDVAGDEHVRRLPSGYVQLIIRP